MDWERDHAGQPHPEPAAAQAAAPVLQMHAAASLPQQKGGALAGTVRDASVLHAPDRAAAGPPTSLHAAKRSRTGTLHGRVCIETVVSRKDHVLTAHQLCQRAPLVHAGRTGMHEHGTCTNMACAQTCRMHCVIQATAGVMLLAIMV